MTFWHENTHHRVELSALPVERLYKQSSDIGLAIGNHEQRQKFSEGGGVHREKVHTFTVAYPVISRREGGLKFVAFCTYEMQIFAHRKHWKYLSPVKWRGYSVKLFWYVRPSVCPSVSSVYAHLLALPPFSKSLPIPYKSKLTEVLHLAISRIGPNRRQKSAKNKTNIFILYAHLLGVTV